MRLIGSARPPYIHIYIYIRHRAARHQGSVSNEKTSCQLPVAAYQLTSPGELLISQVLLRDHMGPISELLEISRTYRMKIFDYFFACFSILHVFTFVSQNAPQKGANKCYKS